MALPEGFQFSKSSLQAYVECPRRFELFYIQHAAWPSIQAEPALELERSERLGQAFHRIAQQDLLGMPKERLAASARDHPLGGEKLLDWWQCWSEIWSQPADNTPMQAKERGMVRKLPEVGLSASADFGEYGSFPYRIVGKYDALALVEGEDGKIQASILDWKTSEKRTLRENLAKSLQTRVYPWLLVSAGAGLTGGKTLLPEEIEMIYWFTGFPDQPERFTYSLQQYQKDSAYLAGLIAEIERSMINGFPATDEDRCGTCHYRSYCDRGIEAGEAGEEEIEELDFESVEEEGYV